MNQVQAFQAGFRALRSDYIIHPLATLPHSILTFQTDIFSVFFDMFIVLCMASAIAIPIASAFELHMVWRLICSSIIASGLLYGLSRHNKAYYQKVVRKYSVAEWYWRESDQLRWEHPSLYYDLLSAQQFLIQLHRWNWVEKLFYGTVLIYSLHQYSNTLFHILPDSYSFRESLCGVRRPRIIPTNPYHLTVDLPEPPWPAPAPPVPAAQPLAPVPPALPFVPVLPALPFVPVPPALPFVPATPPLAPLQQGHH